MAILPFSNLLGSYEIARLSARLIVKPQLSRAVQLVISPKPDTPNYEGTHRIICQALHRLAERARWRRTNPPST